MAFTSALPHVCSATEEGAPSHFAHRPGSGLMGVRCGSTAVSSGWPRHSLQVEPRSCLRVSLWILVALERSTVWRELDSVRSIASRRSLERGPLAFEIDEEASGFKEPRLMTEKKPSV